MDRRVFESSVYSLTASHYLFLKFPCVMNKSFVGVDFGRKLECLYKRMMLGTSVDWKKNTLESLIFVLKWKASLSQSER